MNLSFQAWAKAIAIMQRNRRSLRFVSLALWTALGIITTKAHANPEATAPQDDILEVVDLPLAADLAQGSGLSEQELQESLDVAQQGGMGAAVLSEVLVAEADAVKVRGKKKGLPDWLMARWAAGVRGVDLKGEVKARPDKAKLAPEKKKALQESLKKQRKQRQAERKALLQAVKEQRKAGKAVKFRGKSAHSRLKQPKGAKHRQNEAENANPEQAPQREDSGKHEMPAKGKHGKSAKHGPAHKQGKPNKHAAGKGKSKSRKQGRGKRK